jgi:hypothetical protein
MSQPSSVSQPGMGLPITGVGEAVVSITETVPASLRSDPQFGSQAVMLE